MQLIYNLIYFIIYQYLFRGIIVSIEEKRKKTGSR